MPENFTALAVAAHRVSHAGHYDHQAYTIAVVAAAVVLTAVLVVSVALTIRNRRPAAYGSQRSVDEAHDRLRAAEDRAWGPIE